MRMELTTSPSDSELDSIKQILRDYNQRTNPEFWSRFQSSDENPRPVFVVAKDGDTAVIGGLIASTQFAWLKIEIMSVAPTFQRQGYGRRLLEMAESEAIQRGCKYAFLDTMSYQAPGFYLKCGYEIVGGIPDWDSHDHGKFFFRKVFEGSDLRPESPSIPASAK